VPKEIHELIQGYGGETSCQISKSDGVSDGYLLGRGKKKKISVPVGADIMLFLIILLMI